MGSMVLQYMHVALCCSGKLRGAIEEKQKLLEHWLAQVQVHSFCFDRCAPDNPLSIAKNMCMYTSHFPEILEKRIDVVIRILSP